jgi:hypothetical protein
MGFHLVSCLSAALFGYEDRGEYALNNKWI